MGCPCEDRNMTRGHDSSFTRAVVKIENPEKLVLFHTVKIPASMGTDKDVPPTVGKYCNTLLVYEANDAKYLYSSDGIPSRLSTDVTELEAEVKSLSSSLSDLRDSLAPVAYTGEYTDLENEPEEFTAGDWNILWQ